MRIKICGITQKEDALCAVDAGADAVGFVFHPHSVRFIHPDDAGDIISALPPDVLPVGVFVNTPRDQVLETIRRSGVRALQFHGEESPGSILGYDRVVIKAHRVGPTLDLEVLRTYNVYAHLLDTFVEGVYGGTGKAFDWQVAAHAREFGRIILSGGLNEENIRDAIYASDPHAVDTSSGVELRPGFKDPEKMRLFVRRARDAFSQLAEQKSATR